MGHAAIRRRADPELLAKDVLQRWLPAVDLQPENRMLFLELDRWRRCQGTLDPIERDGQIVGFGDGGGRRLLGCEQYRARQNRRSHDGYKTTQTAIRLRGHGTRPSGVEQRKVVPEIDCTPQLPLMQPVENGRGCGT